MTEPSPTEPAAPEGIGDPRAGGRFQAAEGALDVVGIGNLLVDVLAEVEEDDVERPGSPEGR